MTGFGNRQGQAPRHRTLYHKSQHQPLTSFKDILLMIGMVLLLLAAARFGMHLLTWNTAKWEIQEDKYANKRNYMFLGFSNHPSALETMKNEMRLRPRALLTVSYYNLLHPNVFIINNNMERKDRAFVNLGTMSVHVAKGVLSHFFYNSQVLETRGKKGGTAMFYGDALFPVIYRSAAAYISGGGSGNAGGGISFIRKSPADSGTLRIPYYAYFYLALVLILWGVAYFGRVFFIACFYYLGVFLLFDFRTVLFTAPFHWLINLLGLEVTSGVAAIGAAVVTALFVLLGFTGIFSAHKDIPVEQAMTPWGKGFIWFFLLLPLVLRF